MKILNNTYIQLLLVLLFITTQQVVAQEILTKEQAVSLMLENNFGIKIVEKDLEIAENNKSILNSGFLPEISGQSNASIDLSNLSAEFQNGDIAELQGAQATAYDAGVALNYTLFDGLGRRYNFRQLKEQYNLTELEARETIENTIQQLFSLYYEVAFLTKNVLILEELLEISNTRLERVSYQYEYGQTNKLNVLNAEVDLNTDSINYINAFQDFTNAKRSLNVILGRDANTYFDIDTAVDFMYAADKNVLELEARDNNVRILQANKSIEIGDYDVLFNRSRFLPQINLNSSYSWNKNFNNEASFLASFRSNGLNTGVGLRWNIFDAGRNSVALQNAKVNTEKLILMKQQIDLEVQRDFMNAWDNYQNKLFIFFTLERNLGTNELNFERTNEQFKLGQVNSVEFRQAQINLQNAQNGRDQARYEAKIAELEVMRICGRIMEADY